MLLESEMFPIMEEDEQHRPSLPQLNTTKPAPDAFLDETTPDRLVSSVAKTLDLTRDDIQLFDSFVDLGGDEELAEALKEACQTRGINLDTADVLQCQTLAELQTRVKPLPPRGAGSSSGGAPRLSDGGGYREFGSSSSADDIFAAGISDSLDGCSSPSSARTDHDAATAPDRDIPSELETLLQSTSKVGSVCLLVPNTGPFEGRLVALVTTRDFAPTTDTTDIQLPPEDETDSLRNHTQALRTAVQEWGPELKRPDVWISLRSMAMKAGKPDAQRLQTWAEEVDDDEEQRIMKLQIIEPRRRLRQQAAAKKAKPSPWPERLSTMWREDSEDEPAPSLADRLKAAEEVTQPAPAAEMPDLGEDEFFPLSSMQQLYFRTSVTQPGGMSTISQPGFRFSQSILLQVQGAVEVADAEAAIETLVSRHSMLRARFRLTGEGWAQVIAPAHPSSYRFGHHGAKDDEEVLSHIEHAQASLDVVNGPVFAVEHIRAMPNKQLLFLVAHHLVVDLVSWRIIIHDLDELLQHGTLLSDQSIPFPNWIDHQSYEVGRGNAEPDLPFDIAPVDTDYWNLRQQPNRYGDTEQLSFSVPPDLTAALQRTSGDVLRTGPSDVFLAALLLSFCQSFPDRAAPTIWKQEHGRSGSSPDFNIDETVGWFTSLCPIGVDADARTDLILLLKQMKDTRNAIPHSGIPFFASEFSASASPFNVLPVEVMFNCVDSLAQLRRKDGILEPVAAPDRDASSLSSDVGPDVGRIALFEVSVVMDGDAGTRVEALYNRNARHVDRIEAWMSSFEHLILEAIGRLRVMDPELTMSDAPLLNASYTNLSKLTSDRISGLGLDSARLIETVVPISPAQQEILISQGQDSDCFHVHSIYELSTPDGSPADQARICRAWEDIVSRHPSLRSVFVDSVSEDGLFDQVVLKKISPAMLFVDAGNPEETLASLPAMRTAAAQPRHRLSVCRTSEKTFIRVDASQAICDARSIHNLVAELRQAYAGETPTVDDTLLATYLHQLESADASYSAGVWKLALDGAVPCHFPRLSLQADDRLQSSSFGLEINRRELMNFCVEAKVDAVNVIQLAWALVLRAFVGVDRVTFGYQNSGRDDELLPGVGKAIGSFATILPCSVDLSPSHQVLQCLRSLQELSTSAQKHQNMSLPEIHHALGLNNTELFNTCVSFQDARMPESIPTSFTPTLVTSARTSNSDLCLSAMFIESQLHLNLSYRHLSEAQAHNTISTFERALRVVIDSSSTRSISELDLFTDRDYAQLVVQEWESGAKAEKVEACVHQLALQHAQTRPGAVAVCSWDGDFTYRQMDMYVTRLASYLTNIGVRPGVPVPIVLEKNKWAPVIMLAVLKAGGCFISLDCQDAVTVESTIRQLNPEHVLVTDGAWKAVNPLPMAPVIINDAFFSTTMRQTTPSRTEQPTPEHAACVFYTPTRARPSPSRSIFFTHASLASAFSVQGPALGISEESRVLQLSAFNMDVALVEILATLCYGGCVCVPTANERLHNLGGAIARMGVTWSYMTAVLARRVDPAEVPSLQTLCFRTRSLDEDTYAPWLENRNILLAYGAPDVCPLGVSVTEVSRSKESTIIPPPLMGKFWILNPEDPKRLVPVGTVGELGIDSPVLTPHRFIPGQALVAAPATTTLQEVLDKPRARYLKTGHRVRYLDDGQIQFLSSIRDEIVIAGSPVLVADLELRMRRCLGRGVDVCVEAVTTADSIQVLVAFVELADAFRGPSELDNLSPLMKEKAYAAKKKVEAYMANPRACGMTVPRHHMPTIFVPLKRFPISTSLKVNRRKLQRMVAALPYTQLADMSTVPNPQEVELAALDQKPLPMSSVEELMRRVWAGVLDMVPLDIRGNDSFMSIGGNKHLAAELVVAARRAGFPVSLWDLLNGATLTEVCQSIAASEASFNEARPAGDLKQASQAPSRMTGFDEKFIKEVIAPQLKVQWRDIHDIAEASSHQIRSLEMAMFDAAAGIKCLVLNFNGPVRHQRLEVACEALSRLHPVLRTAFAVYDRRTYQVVVDSFKPVFQRYPCPTWRLQGVSEHVIKQDRALLFSLHEPVTKFSFFDAGETGKLVVRLSTAQIDDATVAPLVQDLIRLYEDLDNVPRKWTFFDYMRAAQAINYRSGIDYWKGQMEGASMTKIVSQAKPMAPAGSIASVRESIQVNPLNSYGITFDTVLKAAWAVVLSTISGSSDVLFGEAIHGHGIPVPDNFDMGSVVGPLANTIPVRVGFPANHSTPLDLMQYVQGQRLCSRPFESLGPLELVQRCTDWSYWARFSTVVQHRSQAPADGSTTLNLANTTFTYSLVEPAVRDAPDLFVCSTMSGSRSLDICIEYPEGRVPQRFAEDAMKLLISALDTLTHYDTVTRPMLPSSTELARLEAKIPLPSQPDADDKQDRVGHLITSDQRSALQSVIYGAWIEILDPTPLGVPEAQVHKASFYDLWGSLLPAHFFAAHLNREIATLKMPGVDKVRLTAADMVANPSMSAQSELIVRRMRDAGAFPNANVAPGGGLSRRKTINHGHKRSSSSTSSIWAPATSPEPSSPSAGLAWTKSMRLRGQESRANIKDLGTKATGWMRHKVSLSKDSTNTIPEDVVLPTTLPMVGGSGRSSESRGSNRSKHEGNPARNKLDTSANTNVDIDILYAEPIVPSAVEIGSSGLDRASEKDQPSEVSPVTPTDRNHNEGPERPRVTIASPTVGIVSPLAPSPLRTRATEQPPRRHDNWAGKTVLLEDD